jgi:hypothetical protein
MFYLNHIYKYNKKDFSVLIGCPFANYTAYFDCFRNNLFQISDENYKFFYENNLLDDLIILGFYDNKTYYYSNNTIYNNTRKILQIHDGIINDMSCNNIPLNVNWHTFKRTFRTVFDINFDYDFDSEIIPNLFWLYTNEKDIQISFSEQETEFWDEINMPTIQTSIGKVGNTSYGYITPARSEFRSSKGYLEEIFS